MKQILRTIIFVALGSSTFVAAPTQYVHAANTQEIVAVVNSDAVSLRDLNRRLKLVMISSGLPNKADIRDKLTPQVLDTLINEKIMLQEAKKQGVEVTQGDIEAGFAQVAQQNNIPADKFKKMVSASGIDINTMYDQIRAQVAWSKVVQKSLRPNVLISDRDIEAARERMEAKVGTTEFLAAEIFLPFDDESKEARVKQLANRLYSETRSGKASFFKLAQQFSRSAGAMQGGDTGWMNEAQIPEEILDGLKKVSKNQITPPIRTLNGYHIYFLRDTRTLSEDTLPSNQQIEYSLGTERLNKVQHRRLQDLRSASFVDIRV